MKSNWTRLALAMAALTLSACGRVNEEAAPPVEDVAPTFAYPMNPNPPALPDANLPITVAGSKLKLTYAGIRDLFVVPDWIPEEHPAMPPIVSSGRKPDVQACGFCHLPTGNGRTENAQLAGLPANYIIAQMDAYRAGLRVSAVPGRGPTTAMEKLGKFTNPEEVAIAAAYFASLKPRSFVQVVETDTIPAVEEVAWIFKKVEGGEMVPLGQRIVETPEDFEIFEKRDPNTKWFAYVPPGSVAKGKTLTESWGEDKALACVTCHGDGMRGKEDVPGLAGKSPTYIVRQLNNFKTGARKGAKSEEMGPVVQTMRTDDMIAVAAYLGSLTP